MTMNQQYPHLPLNRVHPQEEEQQQPQLPLCSGWERVAVKMLTQILANLTSGMYLQPDDIVDSLARASEDLSLHFGRSVTLEEMVQDAEVDVELGMPPLPPHIPTAPVMQSEYDMVFD